MHYGHSFQHRDLKLRRPLPEAYTKSEKTKFLSGSGVTELKQMETAHRMQVDAECFEKQSKTMKHPHCNDM
jgi:hypothetical protein